jgi:p38 MAP kinase
MRTSVHRSLYSNFRKFTLFSRSSASATFSFHPWRTCALIILSTFPFRPHHLPLGSYFVTELLGTDLHRLLTSRPLEKQFIQYFLYQILVIHILSGVPGLLYLCSAWTQIRALGWCRPPRSRKYRDSVPSLSLASHSYTTETKQYSCKRELRSKGADLIPLHISLADSTATQICDFGLARIQDPQMTGYVSTRYYRAPEIMLTWQKYDVAVDIWSTGCIFAEMLEGKPLFPGKDRTSHVLIMFPVSDIW